MFNNILLFQTTVAPGTTTMVNEDELEPDLGMDDYSSEDFNDDSDFKLGDDVRKNMKENDDNDRITFPEQDILGLFYEMTIKNM